MQLVDYRVEFTKWWVTEFKTVKFPTQGTVFDYFIDTESHKFEPWTKKVANFELDPEMPLQVNIVVHQSLLSCKKTFSIINFNEEICLIFK